MVRLKRRVFETFFTQNVIEETDRISTKILLRQADSNANESNTTELTRNRFVG